MRLKHHHFPQQTPSIDNREPVIILHGLFGSARNWFTIARKLSKSHNIYMLDLRNHGESPHSPVHNITVMREDLEEWIESQLHEHTKPVLLGHSMGGLVSMSYALEHPDRVSALIIEDIAPRTYPPNHEAEFEAMMQDLSDLKRREDVEERLSRWIEDRSLRQFLMTNLVRIKDPASGVESFQWRVPVAYLRDAPDRTRFDASIHSCYSGPALFIKGSLSNFIQNDDHQLIKNYFPNASVVTIEGADHWPHHSSMEEFLNHLERFLAS